MPLFAVSLLQTRLSCAPVPPQSRHSSSAARRNGRKSPKASCPTLKATAPHVTHAPHLQELFMQRAHLHGARLYVIPCVVPPHTQIANFVWMAVNSSRISVSNSSIDSTIFSSLNLSIKKYSVFLGYSINNSYLCKTTNKFCTNHEHD